MRSLGHTLAVRFCATVLVALILIGFWAYLGAQRVLRKELDSGLQAAFELEHAVLASGAELQLQLDTPDHATFVGTINRYVAVRDHDGAILDANTRLARHLPVRQDALAAVRERERVWTTDSWRGTHLRSLYGSTPTGSVLQVSASLAPLEAANREILFLIAGTVLLGSLATAMGATWLARSSLAPVREITSRAEAIPPSGGQRITVHGDVEEFHGLVKVLNAMLERIDRTLDAQRRMIADAGHDLRTPITAMRGEIEVALRTPRDTNDYQAVLRSVLEEVEHLGTISDSLILLARVEAGTLEPHRVPTDVAGLVRALGERPDGRADGWMLTIAAPDEHVDATVDPRLLQVVLEQLLDNTVKHTPPRTRVIVELKADHDWLRIAVDDDGPGIAPDALPHLFERFYRDDVARTRLGGAGLGLSVAAAIVQAHGGAIEARRSDRGGLRVDLRLPRSQ
jgi:signal transduction histidine kinase